MSASPFRSVFRSSLAKLGSDDSLKTGLFPLPEKKFFGGVSPAFWVRWFFAFLAVEPEERGFFMFFISEDLK